jgi:hypothetical protein
MTIGLNTLSVSSERGVYQRIIGRTLSLGVTKGSGDVCRLQGGIRGNVVTLNNRKKSLG